MGWRGLLLEGTRAVDALSVGEKEMFARLANPSLPLGCEGTVFVFLERGPKCCTHQGVSEDLEADVEEQVSPCLLGSGLEFFWGHVVEIPLTRAHGCSPR